MTLSHIIAIPARNEAEHIEACLRSLAGQAERVVLLVNNSTDGTETLAKREAAALGLPLHVSVQHFPAAQCTAGHARKVALDLAAGLAPGAVLFTTDADSRVAPNWVAANLRHMEAGVDAVAGRAVIDPVDAAAIPARLHEDDARECAYGTLLDEIASVLDPDPADAWPRHTEHSGASICVSARAFQQAGGVPDIPLGEDRGLFAALRRIDKVIRHAPEVTVTVSGRIVGRASGGMADTIRRRLDAPDPFLDDALEPAAAAGRRAWLRALARAAWRTPDPERLAELADELCLAPAGLRTVLRTRFFGQAWERLEESCAVLARSRVPASDVLAETERARELLSSLRLSSARRTDPAGRSQPADAQAA